MNHVSQESLVLLHRAIMLCDLSGSRVALLGGLDPGFRAGLPLAASPSEQILVDLHTLNGVQQLSDGTIPLLVWAQNALALSASRRESLPLVALIDQLKRPSAPAGATVQLDGSPSALQVSDVQVLSDFYQRVCTLDFRVWNRGRHDIIINRVLLKVVWVHEVEIVTCGIMPFSQVYDFDISHLRSVGDEFFCNISQILRPGEVDRFGVRVTADHLRHDGYRTWQLQCSLASNVGITRGPIVELTLPLQGSCMSHLLGAGLAMRRTLSEVLHVAIDNDLPKAAVDLGSADNLSLDSYCLVIGDPLSIDLSVPDTEYPKDDPVCQNNWPDWILTMKEVRATTDRASQNHRELTDRHLLESLAYYLRWRTLMPKPGVLGSVVHDPRVLEIDRHYYFTRGGELRNTQCQAPNCKRGRVVLSVFCRVHQFEAKTGRKCPFDD